MQFCESLLYDAEQRLLPGGEFHIILATMFFFLKAGVNDPFDLAFGQSVFPTKLNQVANTIFHFGEHRAVGTRQKTS